MGGAAFVDCNLAVGIAISGQCSSSTNILLDCSDNNNTFIASVRQNVPLDSVQEFSIVSSSFMADISSQLYVPGYRDGRRNVQFALKFIF